MNHWVRVIIEDALRTGNEFPSYVSEGLDRAAAIVEASEEVQLRTRVFEDIAYALPECTDLRELSAFLFQTAKVAGFHGFSIFVVSHGLARAFGTRMCTSYSNEWIERYRNKRYRFIDPVFHRATLADGSFCFSEIQSSAPMVKAFWDDAENHGIGRNGICHVITRNDHSRVALSISTTASLTKTMENLRLNGHDLRVLSEIAIDRFCELSSGRPLCDGMLSDDELRFLHSLATNSNSYESHFNTCETSQFHAIQRSICRKLGVGTIFQALAISSSMKWFDELPFDPDEIITPF